MWQHFPRFHVLRVAAHLALLYKGDQILRMPFVVTLAEVML